MDRNRIGRLLAEAGIQASPPPYRDLADLADGALALAGVGPGDAARIHASFREVPRDSAAALALGTGFSAWGLSQTDRLLHHAIERGGDVVEFVRDNLDVLTAGWSEAAPIAGQFLVEFALKLPGGTLQVGADVLNLVENFDRVSDAIALKMEAGLSLGDAMDAVGIGADVLDGFASFGTGIVLGWVATRLLDRHYGPQLQARMQRLTALREKTAELLKLRAALKTELPGAVLAGQLARVEPRSWGF